MNRWNIAAVYLFSHDGRRRTLPFNAANLNIITGESGTGKSALWKIIDYCLGSSGCVVPNLITDRCSAFAIHWKRDDLHLLTARLAPTPSQATSNTMFVVHGRDLEAPKSSDNLRGRMNVGDAKSIIESAFGIGAVDQERSSQETKSKRITVRHSVPYLFLPGQILMSESALVHGMDDKQKAEDIQKTIQYFLRIVDEDTLAIENQIRQLTHALEVTERRERAAQETTADSNNDAKRLLHEAEQVGVVSAGTSNTDDPIAELRSVLEWTPTDVPVVGENELTQAYRDQEEAIERIRNLERQRRAAKRFVQESLDYSSTIAQQEKRLSVVELLNEDSLGSSCPVCGSTIDDTDDTVSAVRNAYKRLQEQGEAGRRRAPQLERVLDDINENIDSARESKREIDQRLEQLVAESDSAQRIRSYNERAARIVGRVSYFIDSYDRGERTKEEGKSSGLAKQLEDLKATWNKEARERERASAERALSDHMTNIVACLPVEEPLEGARVHIALDRVSLWIETPWKRKIPFAGIGSDENYMALHIALLVAIHRLASDRGSPIPGILVIDQVSRPYFPALEGTSQELDLGDGSADKETRSLRKHIEFLFSEVDGGSDLQILLLEHAYFSGDTRYVDSVVERWTEASGLKLVPPDWPSSAPEAR
ncbi:DUF3732 domain-containing protein [Halomonadaceae bacterium KBTZ08]